MVSLLFRSNIAYKKMENIFSKFCGIVLYFFSGHTLTSCCSVCLYYCDRRISQKSRLSSEPFITPRTKNYSSLKKSFFNNMVGTFCASCTAAGHLWFAFLISYDVV